MKVHPMSLQMWPIEPRSPISWISRDNFGGSLIPAGETPSWRQKSWLAPKIMPHLTNCSTSLPPCLGLGPKQKRKGSHSKVAVAAHHCMACCTRRPVGQAHRSRVRGGGGPASPAACAQNFVWGALGPPPQWWADVALFESNPV